MEKFNQNFENKIKSLEKQADEVTMDSFYKEYFESDDTKIKKISLENLKELKEKGITTEKFLDFICQKYGMLLHGSVNDITDEKLKSHHGKIFASDKSAIAIMRSMYSNTNVNLEYPYHVTEENPLVLKVHTPSDNKFIKVDRGFVYVVDRAGFRNEPKGSWQYVKEGNEVIFSDVVETENDDFKYPVNFITNNSEI